MAHNSIGKLYTITSFGESHGPLVGVIIDGYPSNKNIDLDFVAKQLARRKPGQSQLTTERQENDEFEILSGVFEGKSTGAPICIIIKNKDAKSQDYENLKTVYRPGHADFTYQQKYGNRDHRGGGRSSARITAGWVAAGALAHSYLKQHFNIEIAAYVHQVGTITAPKDSTFYTQQQIDMNPVRCPHQATAEEMLLTIENAKQEGNSVGGKIKCQIINLPVGLGEPIFNKLNAYLSYYLMNINAVRSIEFGNAAQVISAKGSEVSDHAQAEGDYQTPNFNAGSLGGISTGQPVSLYLGFKPTSSIGQAQAMYNQDLKINTQTIQGRHDPCVLPRAVPIVESMVASALLDLILMKS